MKKVNKIPKVIHYCWFGGNPIPEELKNYMKTWKKFCPDYKIIEWNESNFDINICPYVKEAYEQKKWSYVSDYVRIYALYNYGGGIYLDTDIELLKNLDKLLSYDAFFAFEYGKYIQTAIMGFEPHNKFLKELIEIYNKRHFIVNGEKVLTTNVELITEIFKEKGLIMNNELQTIDNITFLPSKYFISDDEVQIKETYTVHHMYGSGYSEYEIKMKKVRRKYKKIFGIKLGNEIFDIVTLIPRSYHFIKDEGIKFLLNKYKEKIKNTFNK